MPEGSFVYSTISFIEEVPTEMGIKALENGSLLAISKANLQKLFIAPNGKSRSLSNRTKPHRL